MTVEATNQNQVSDEELEQQITELRQKEDLDDDDKQQLDSLKKERGTRYSKRIGELTGRAKSAEEKLAEKERQLEELNGRVKELETSTPATPIMIDKQEVEIGGKKYYTDETLNKMVDNKEITFDQANAHAIKRNKEEIKDEVRQEFRQNDSKRSDQEIRANDAKAVLKEFPHFDRTNANFNAEDPLYKEANRIYKNGYSSNPNGLSLAVKEAKRLLNINDNHADLTDELNVGGASHPGSRKANGKEKEATLSEADKDSAIRMWTRQINPKTNRNYTDEEAINKAKKAKSRRM
jgi:hypothetical protein